MAPGRAPRFPLGAPDDPELQRALLEELLGLCERTDVPVLAESEVARRISSR
ncbi:MAG: hypothetical protein ACQEXJ_15420 [Myxococcota bacterium]